VRYDPAVETIASLRLVDRPFIVGDVVAAAAQPTGAIGAITEVCMTSVVRRVAF